MGGGDVSMATKGMGGKLTLTYFNAYGRAEPHRLLMSHAKVDFVDKRITGAEFGPLKATKYRGRGLPTLEHSGMPN